MLPNQMEGRSLSEEDFSELGKALAGAEAAEAVEAGMKLGLGTGSTVAHFLRELGRRHQRGELPGIVGVATSERTEAAATALGIPLTTLEEVEALDLTVDGADEVDPNLDLIKGLGGALLREKMVAQATRRMIIIADERKVVGHLGTRSPLPVEVVPFSWRCHVPFLHEQGARAVMREVRGGQPFTTDNGNFILDCHFSQGISDPSGLNDTLEGRAGIVGTGLFLNLADEILVGGPGTVRRITRKSRNTL